MSFTKETLGKLATILIFLLLFYNVSFATFKLFVENTMNAFITSVNNASDSVKIVVVNNTIIAVNQSTVLPTTTRVILAIFSWWAFIFTNSTALMTLIAIDILKDLLT